MRFDDLLLRISLPDLIARECGPDAVRGLTREGGGVICDPRPGQRETRPSFSVYKQGEVWRWKRHGGDEASGNAYGFLLELGYSETQAREELHRLAGVPLDGWQTAPRPRVAYTPPSALDETRRTLASITPLNAAEQARLVALVAPLEEADSAAQDLQRRGLWEYAGLQTARLRSDFRRRDGRLIAQSGALAFLLRDPNGRTAGLKVRNLGTADELHAAGLSRYIYRLAGHGAPAWCSLGYGQGRALLIVEGELNGAAASRASEAVGLSLDVQGLAGAGGVPYLEGVAGRVVYLSFDADEAGRAGLERIARIVHQAGAAEVRVLAALPASDFCDLAGSRGVGALGAVLADLLQTSTIHHTISPSGETSGVMRGAAFAPLHHSLGFGAMVQRRPEEIALQKHRARLDKKFGVWL